MLDNLFEKIKLRHFLIVSACLLVAYSLWLFSTTGTQALRSIIGYLVIILTRLVVVILLYTRMQNKPFASQIHIWRWFTASFVLWLLHDITLAISPLLNLPTTGEQFSTILYLCGIITFWVGLFRFPTTPRTVYNKAGLFLDILLTNAAVVILVGITIFRTVFALLPAGYTFTAYQAMADFLTLLILLNIFLFSEIDSLSRLLGWFSVTMLAFVLSDMGYTGFYVYGSAYQAGTPVDLGWILGNFFLMLAFLTRVEKPDPEQHMPYSGFLTRIRALFPIASLLVLAWYTLTNWRIAGQFDPISIWATLALGLGLLLRQGILAGEVALEQYARLVNSIAEPAFVCNRQGRLQMVNPAFLEISDYQRLDLIGTSLVPIISTPDEEGDWFMQINQANQMRNFAGVDREVLLKTRKGDLIPVLLSLRPVLSGNRRQLALAGTAHDLRLQKRQQANLQNAYEEVAQARSELEDLNQDLERLVNEKTADLQQTYLQLEEQNKTLQQLDQLKSDFVSLVSHELRAPLTNIRGGIELLLSNKELPAEKRDNILSRVNAEILRLSQFTETILDLSALDANRLPLYPEPLHLYYALESLMQHFQQLQNTQRIIWQVAEDLPMVYADQKAIHSILFHLLDNAIKYAPQGDITVSASASDHSMNIQVCDHGPGIPEESLPMLFDRFYRARMEDAQTTYGHGLGLYLVRRFAEAMHGKVAVSNRSEGGACFSLVLPLAEDH